MASGWRMEEGHGRMGNNMETTTNIVTNGKSGPIAMDHVEIQPLPTLAITTLKEEAADADSGRPSPMERTPSLDIREEREDLKEAAEQSPNVILDLSLNGVIRWVSPSWKDVIGTAPESVQGKPIAELLLDYKDALMTAVDSMKKDDSRSQIIRFTIEMGPLSRLAPDVIDGAVDVYDESLHPNGPPEEKRALTLEGQGIMVYDRSSGGESHTMWMLRPFVQPREITIDLPLLLVESLGVGAEMLAHYLTSLAEFGLNDPGNNAPPLPVLCRICERQIPPWWFEKHSDLCLQEHKAELEVQMAQESLTEHRNAIVKVLDALEARKSRQITSDVMTPVPQAEYKGLPIGPPSTPSTGPSSGTSSPASPPVRSRDSSATGFGHGRGRSFAIRRPQARIVELLLDLCDTAIEISTPAIKDSLPTAGGELRTQSPQSESRIGQVIQWQSPSTNTLDQEQGLALLCADTEAVARAKVEAVRRHKRIIEYSERIRIEFTLLVQDCIDAAMRKAAQIAAGQLSDSSSSTDDETPAQDDAPFFAGSFDGPSSLAAALRNASDPSIDLLGDRRRSSTAVSTRSSSPKECPTPRSHKGAIKILGQAPHYKRSSIHFESDPGESDSSMRSSLIAATRRTESPGSDHELRLGRTASTRARKRSSLRLSGAISPRRQQSPSRPLPPSSPLRITKPRIPSLHDSLPSPITSPLLSGGDFSSPALEPHLNSHHHHHRRQSSAASSDVLRPPLSPRLTTVSHPQARAVPPSIKDFEIIKPISKGAFGSVYLSKKKSTGDYFAIKVLKKADMIAKNQVTNVKAERAIMMSQGESDFVAKLFWTFSSKDYLYLVMEYLNGGDCASLIKVLGGLTEDWAKKYLAEVVLGVEHLHGRGIVHRDLKPDNLLIDQNGHLKLTDFGLSRIGLVGRQKRILNSGNESTPDLLKQGPFARSTSVASSRSASLDLLANQSPSNTPLMTPDPAAQLAQPSYFNLSRGDSLRRDNSRRRSNHRSDSGGSETLQSMLSSFSLNETGSFMVTQRNKAIDEDNQSEGSSSSDFNALHNVTSHTIQAQHNTPPQSSMMPPQMALFDPEDTNRKFVGTPDYLAPETINGVGQDELSDWWSLGCILFEFLYGYPPFHADSPDKVFENILQRRIDWPDEEEFPVSPEAKDLMNRLMCTNPRQRIGANIDENFSCGGEEIRSHPWFQGINWETLLEDEAQFVPKPENPEDTEYFDCRGATLQSFAEELEDQASSPAITPGADYPERPHDALSRVRTQANSMKRGLMPLHIPPHVRDGRSRRLSEPLAADDFGNFSFKNLPVLEKANKDVIQKLRAEAMQVQGKASQLSSIVNSPTPSLEGSPILPMPPKRQLSISKGSSGRPASPSNLSISNSSPSRPSQPSSPLLVSFTASQPVERRKTSSTSSSLSTNSLQPGSFFEVPKITTTAKVSSSGTSPIKTIKTPAPLQLSPQRIIPTTRQANIPTSRARSQTVGSQEGEIPLREVFHHKRRSGVFDMSPSSSDNEDARANALLRVQRRRQSSRRLSQINLADGPMFRSLDVLICEDHPVSRMVMEKLLEKLRCRTMTVDNGSEAARCAMSEVKFDIIMMEFKLPQISGEDVARMIRDTKNANSQTPIVAVTGYLKDLQAPHHFDALIEKPATTSKLIEVMSRLCQWKAPPLDRIQALAPSGLRQESARPDDSPSSGSSGFAHIHSSGFPGSSREDSVGSSFFGDSESVMTDDMPVIISRQGTSDWEDGGLGGGLGILPGDVLLDAKDPPLPRLIQQESAPAALPSNVPKKQRSAEKVKAKRVSIEKKRHECAESGDDEDEELGNIHRSKSPQGPRIQRGSKLGQEMLRTNSRGSVISGSGISIKEGESPPANSNAELGNSEDLWTEILPSITPPEIFPKIPGGTALGIDMDITPRPSSHASQEVPDEDPTPRALSIHRYNMI